MPGTNLTRDEARTRADLLAVESYAVDLDLDPSRSTDLRLHDHDPVHEPRAGASTFADLVGATIHEITLNGRSLDPADVYADHRIRLDDLAEPTTSCAWSPTALQPHRRGPAPLRRPGRRPRLPLLADRGARRPPGVHHLRAARPQVGLHTSRSPRRRTGWSCPTRRPPSRSRRPTARRVWRFPATERMSTYITAIVAGEYHADPRHLRRQARRDPAGALLPPVDGAVLRHRRARRGHQAGLRLLRGRLRLPLPVPQVRPALRARVQQRRDGERRLRDAARRVPPPQPAGRAGSTSSAPTRSCTRWRTCGSATS